MVLTVPAYGTHSFSLWNAQFQPMKLTVPTYETHSSNLWNAQFQSMKLSWNTVARRLRSVRRALGKRIAGVSGTSGACFSPPFGERSAPVCGLVLPAAVGPRRGRREKNPIYFGYKIRLRVSDLSDGREWRHGLCSVFLADTKSTPGRPRKGRPGHGCKNENTNL